MRPVPAVLAASIRYDSNVNERLQKILSRAGIASRRAAEKIILEGRVWVNGSPVVELGSKADVVADDIRVDGRRLKPPAPHVYVLLHKPRGFVTTRRDPEGRATVMTLVPDVAGLFPIGRLDVTTEGLLLLTNDGEFAQRVAHPKYGVTRVYQAKVHRVPTAATLARLKKGVNDQGDKLAFDEVKILGSGDNPWLEVTLHEGKNREVRRALEAVGHPVSRLKRVAIGPLTSRGLAVGQWRALTREEVRRLLGKSTAKPQAAARIARPKSRPRTVLPKDAGQSRDSRRAGRPKGAGASRNGEGVVQPKGPGDSRDGGRAVRPKGPGKSRDRRAALPQGAVPARGRGRTTRPRRGRA
jgi:23S rRNA pseudouridine2605 synthase